MARKSYTTDDAFLAASVAMKANPANGPAVALQVGRLIAAKAVSFDQGRAFLVTLGVSAGQISNGLFGAAKKPSGAGAVCAALAKLVAPVSATPRRRAPAVPRDIDLFGKALPRKNASPREDVVQSQVVAILSKSATPGVFWFHPANGGYRNIRTATRLKAQGVRAGVPDLAVTINGRSHFLELKRAKGGVVSPEQKAMRVEIETAGGVWALARGFDEALSVLRDWGAIAA